MTVPSEAQTIVPEEFDLVVIGSGEGSKFLAWTLARQGQRVAMIEQRWIGGSCPNIACLPSKNIIHSAKVASYFSRAAEFGIKSGSYSVDMAAVTGRKRRMVKELVDIHIRNFETSGTTLIIGHAHFIAPKLIEVDLADGSKRHVTGSQCARYQDGDEQPQRGASDLGSSTREGDDACRRSDDPDSPEW